SFASRIERLPAGNTGRKLAAVHLGKSHAVEPVAQLRCCRIHQFSIQLIRLLDPPVQAVSTFARELLQTALQGIQPPRTHILEAVAKVQMWKERPKRILSGHSALVEHFRHPYYRHTLQHASGTPGVLLVWDSSPAVCDQIELGVCHHIWELVKKVLKELRHKHLFRYEGDRILIDGCSTIELVHRSQTIQRIPKYENLLKLDPF